VDVEAERLQPEGDDEGGSVQPDQAVAAFDLEFDLLGERLDAHRERRVLVEHAAAADLQAHDVVAHEVDAQLLTVQRGGQATIGRLN
jgi:hypothetical protein